MSLLKIYLRNKKPRCFDGIEIFSLPPCTLYHVGKTVRNYNIYLSKQKLFLIAGTNFFYYNLKNIDDHFRFDIK